MYGEDLQGKLMYLPPKVAPIMEPLTGRQVIIEDVEGGQWPVLLSRVDGNLALTDGWAPFFRHHNIEELSVLTFEYEGESNSLFVRVYEDTGREALRNKRAANSAQAPDAKSSQEGTRVSITTSPCQCSRRDSNEKLLVDSDMELTSDEIIEGDQLPSAYNEVTSPVERCEFMDKLDSLEKHYGSEVNVECIKNLGFKGRARDTEITEPNKSEGVKRKSDALVEEAVNSVGGDSRQQKRPALDQPMSETGHALPKYQATDIRQSDSAIPKYTGLQIIPSTTVREDHKQVLYLKDPKGRIWPFLNEDVDRRSVKLSTDKWKEFCDENDIIKVDDCLFEVEQADLGVYNVRHVASRGSAA